MGENVAKLVKISTTQDINSIWENQMHQKQLPIVCATFDMFNNFRTII